MEVPIIDFDEVIIIIIATLYTIHNEMLTTKKQSLAPAIFGVTTFISELFYGPLNKNIVSLS